MPRGVAGQQFFDPYRMRPGMPMHGMMPGMPMVGPGSAHSMQMMPPNGGHHQGHAPPMSQMQAMQMMHAMHTVQAMGLRPGMVQQPPPPAANVRPGDWFCPNPSCNNHNFADKSRCNRCKIPRPGDGPWPGGQAQGLSTTANMRAGDWLCRACGNHNFADKSQCNRCNIPKQVYIAAVRPRRHPTASDPTCPERAARLPQMQTGLREGDWLCPACQNHNYADKLVCNKCAAPKASMHIVHEGGKGSAKRLRDNDWECQNVNCQNVNYASRLVCNRCGGARLKSSAEPAAAHAAPASPLEVCAEPVTQTNPPLATVEQVDANRKSSRVTPTPA